MHGVDIERNGRASVVRGSGELDAFAAPDLAAAFERVRAAPAVVADLAAVSFLDSTALGAIVRAVRALDDGGVPVRVVLPRGSARRIFEITTLDRVLPVAETRDAAFAALELAD
jgi:anti-sigma B factor antagonist